MWRDEGQTDEEQGLLTGMWELYLTDCSAVTERGNPRGSSTDETSQRAKERSVSWQDGAGGGRKRSRPTGRLNARHVWNGVRLYGAQCGCVHSLLGLSLEELPLPVPIGTTRHLLP